MHRWKTNLCFRSILKTSFCHQQDDIMWIDSINNNSNNSNKNNSSSCCPSYIQNTLPANGCVFCLYMMDSWDVSWTTKHHHWHKDRTHSRLTTVLSCLNGRQKSKYRSLIIISCKSADCDLVIWWWSGDHDLVIMIWWPWSGDHDLGIWSGDDDLVIVESFEWYFFNPRCYLYIIR